MGSAHIQYFDLESAEPLAIDDMENRVADGLSFQWKISLPEDVQMKAGQEETFVPASYRNGSSEEESGVEYLWSSSDENILLVGAEGHVKAVQEGNASIVCSLKKNPSIAAKMAVTVVSKETSIPASLEWVTPVPEQLAKYDECTIEAAYYADGVKTEESITYSFSGPDDAAYSATQSGNIVQVKCWLPSTQPLVMTAECKNIIKTVEIKLTGW